ncbi:MAG TPA: FkbM family methyltransferase [Candidatus Paceibacterota bacterium]|nr:FkbM family methyltransferase [Candidatus Paceibacterota bacterium]
MAIKQILRRFGIDIVRYRPFWKTMVPRNIKTIIDIGASDGVFAKEMRARFPEASIYSFEPLHDAYERLQITMQGDKKFHAFNMALGLESGETIINRSSSTPSSSLLTMAELHKTLYPKSASHTKEKIQIEKLDTVLGNRDLEKPVLVKIDVQGFEDKVIQGGRNVIGNADIAIIETSFTTLYENQPLFGDIHDLMRILNFSYRGRYETHYSERTGEPIYEDSVYTK